MSIPGSSNQRAERQRAMIMLSVAFCGVVALCCVFALIMNKKSVPSPLSVPAATAHREAPAATAHREAPAATAHREAPAATAHREAPAATAHREAPAATAHREAPAATAHREAPAATAHREAPAATAHREAPAATAHREAPAATAHREAPPIQPSKPALTETITQLTDDLAMIINDPTKKDESEALKRKIRQLEGHRNR